MDVCCFGCLSDTGHGDYTAERDKLHEGLTFEEIITNVRETDADN